MRNEYTLLKLVQSLYPYYGEVSIKENIKYISRSTLISDDEENLLYRRLSEYQESKTVNEGKNLLSIMIDSFLTT